jgi:hypothetical protein
MCKYWKMNGYGHGPESMRFSEYRRYYGAREDIKAFRRGEMREDTG